MLLQTKEIREALGPNSKLYVALASDQVGRIKIPDNPYITVMLLSDMKLLRGFGKHYNFLVTTVTKHALPLLNSAAREMPSKYAFVQFSEESSLQNFLATLDGWERAVPAKPKPLDDEEIESDESSSIAEQSDHTLQSDDEFAAIASMMYIPKSLPGKHLGKDGKSLPSLAQVVCEALMKKADQNLRGFSDYKGYLVNTALQQGYERNQINLSYMATLFANFKSRFITAAKKRKRELGITPEQEKALAKKAATNAKFRYLLGLVVKHRHEVPEAAQLLKQL